MDQLATEQLIVLTISALAQVLMAYIMLCQLDITLSQLKKVAARNRLAAKTVCRS